jgi:uncharacterized damage-inducible protein DinB
MKNPVSMPGLRTFNNKSPIMYSSIAGFAEDWTLETKLTVTIFEAVADGRKSEKLNEHVRSLDRLAWHITQTLSEMPHKAGLMEADDLEHRPIPVTMQEIIAVYKQYSSQLLELVQQKWTDEELKEEVNMYGANWTKGKILTVLVHHQIHHRGQMTTLMRLLDMKVPGIYGPAREEWARFGMAAMD